MVSCNSRDAVTRGPPPPGHVGKPYLAASAHKLEASFTDALVPDELRTVVDTRTLVSRAGFELLTQGALARGGAAWASAGDLVAKVRPDRESEALQSGSAVAITCYNPFGLTHQVTRASAVVAHVLLAKRALARCAVEVVTLVALS